MVENNKYVYKFTNLYGEIEEGYRHQPQIPHALKTLRMCGDTMQRYA